MYYYICLYLQVSSSFRVSSLFPSLIFSPLCIVPSLICWQFLFGQILLSQCVESIGRENNEKSSVPRSSRFTPQFDKRERILGKCPYQIKSCCVIKSQDSFGHNNFGHMFQTFCSILERFSKVITVSCQKDMIDVFEKIRERYSNVKLMRKEYNDIF